MLVETDLNGAGRAWKHVGACRHVGSCSQHQQHDHGHGEHDEDHEDNFDEKHDNCKTCVVVPVFALLGLTPTSR